MIALIDYGAGNLTSVRKGFAAAGADVMLARAPGDLAGASGVVVPGVGHFGATASLDEAWRAAILRRHRDRAAAVRDLPRHAVALRGEHRGASVAVGSVCWPAAARGSTIMAAR